MSNFTPRAQQVLALARKEADRFNHNYVGTEHLLLGLIKLGQGVAVNVLQRMGLDLDTVRLEVEKHVGTGPETKMAGNIPYTPRVKKVLALAGKEAKALNHSYVGTEHILLGLLREGEGVAARVLESLNIDIERSRQEILKELDPNFSGGGDDDDDDPAESDDTEERRPQGAKKDPKTPALKAFGRDLTELAREGGLDPVIGRTRRNRAGDPDPLPPHQKQPGPHRRGRRRQNRHRRRPRPGDRRRRRARILRDKKVITLDLALMVAGTKYRGQFEERIKAVMDEIRRSRT
jgi:ATP-dependent Clp protease ATP-binding subunit ClpC